VVGWDFDFVELRLSEEFLVAFAWISISTPETCLGFEGERGVPWSAGISTLWSFAFPRNSWSPLLAISTPETCLGFEGERGVPWLAGISTLWSFAFPRNSWSPLLAISTPESLFVL